MAVCQFNDIAAKQMCFSDFTDSLRSVYNVPMRDVLFQSEVRRDLTSVEICAGAGGQALGLERAGFRHVCLVELDAAACATLRLNRPTWNVVQGDVRTFSAPSLAGIDLLAGGVPCPPFSKAGKQLGADDERDLFPEALRLVEELAPRAVMLENVRGLMDTVFDSYRQRITDRLIDLGYRPEWKLLHASAFGVPQNRPRVIMVALHKSIKSQFKWPDQSAIKQSPNVGDAVFDLMAANGWRGADEWRSKANRIAPTIVGGSKRHGGPDLGPTRARNAWAELGVNGKLVANNAPEPDHEGMPCLTVRMVARLQGFPDDWQFVGPKTSAYRQVGNAFPPPVAMAIGARIRHHLAEMDDIEGSCTDGPTISHLADTFPREPAGVGFAY